MSNLFEEFGFEEPEYLDTSLCETDDERRLKERFDSLTSRNELELALFNPLEPQAFKLVKTHSIESELEEDDPQLAFMLTMRMLKTLHLNIPSTSDDEEYITEREYKNGKRLVIFTVTREDQSIVPVYYETDTDGVSPVRIYLMSFEKAQETVMHYRDIDEHRTQVRMRLGAQIGDRVLSRFDVSDLKWFSEAYDHFQQIPVRAKDNP